MAPFLINARNFQRIKLCVVDLAASNSGGSHRRLLRLRQTAIEAQSPSECQAEGPLGRFFTRRAWAVANLTE
jgi:hypothetical protein